MKSYYVYILTNKPRGVLYIGVTNDLARRIAEHCERTTDSFTKKYYLKKLVFFEQYQYVQDALTLEKRLKNWHREWKIDLIEKKNPDWNDLFESRRT